MGAHTPQFLKKEGEGGWLLCTGNVPSVSVSMSCNTGSKPMGRSAIAATIPTVRVRFSSYSTTTKGVCQR